MPLSIDAMEPAFPQDGTLDRLALDLSQEAAALGSRLHPVVRRKVALLLRTINTYHSNLIEGHDTRPRDIERALAGDYTLDPERRALQLEARAHIDVQELIDARFATDAALPITTPAFLQWIHAEFYARMPMEWRMVGARNSALRMEVVPGALRSMDVVVGSHHPPPPDQLQYFLGHFAAVYEPAHLPPLGRVVAAAASHHRLLWIHPFLDGNGRVARLFSDAYLRRANVGGHGLWTVSRGLARQRGRYLQMLAAADEARWNDYDGRGQRSARALADFCTFFLESCLDQVRYMASLLDLETLVHRIDDYVNRRARGLVDTPIPLAATPLLREVLLRGEVPRGDAGRAMGVSDRTARRVVSVLVREGLLTSTTPKGALQIGLPVAAVEYYFPQLFSASASAADVPGATGT